VRGVVNRTLAAGVVAVPLVAVLVAGVMLTPAPASARAGGFAAGHVSFNHGDFRRFGGLPLVRPGQMPPIVVSAGPPGINRIPALDVVRHHRRVFGLGIPVAGVGVSYGPFDQPIADVGLHAADDGARAGWTAANRGGCRSETRIVASEAGGERPIRITWCRNG
jgi:hypothetical protein